MAKRKSTDETGRFMKAIAAFSALPEVTSAQGRSLQIEPKGTAQAILSEISETVLHRHLTISRDDGDQIILDVTERRVLAVIGAPQCSAANYASLTERQLAEEDAADLFAFVGHFAKDTKALFVRSHLPKNGNSGFDGVPVNKLIELAARVQNQDLPAHLAQVIAESIDQSTSLVAYRDEVCLVEQGSQQDREALKARLTDWTARSGPTRQVTLWAASADMTKSTILVRDSEIKVAMSSPHAIAPSFFALWHQAIFAG